jgi:tRNA(Ile)-lysidine synthase
MLNKVKAAITQYSMDCSNVTVALSGGADSVALLYALRESGCEVGACHVNHNLRGNESDRDEAFVRELCAGLGVPLTVRSVDVRALQKKHRSLEETARNVRYEFFAEISRESPGVTLATAHTASDNAETVLLNLIRGTGLKGLCGIPPVRGNIVRPLILCERSEVEAYCESHGLRYVTDSANSSEEFTRNKIRLNIMPLIKEINPSFSVTQMCEILREDSDYLESRACCRDYSESRIPYSELEKPLLSRIIKQTLTNNNISPSALRIKQIMEAVKAGRGKINLEKHKFAVVEDGILKIETIFQKYR